MIIYKCIHVSVVLDMFSDWRKSIRPGNDRCRAPYFWASLPRLFAKAPSMGQPQTPGSLVVKKICNIFKPNLDLKKWRIP